MTKIIVSPIELSAPGSYRVRSRFMRLVQKVRRITKEDLDGTMDSMLELEDFVLSRLETDDGTPVAEALDKLSAKQFDELYSAIAFEDPVPPENASNSETSPEDTPLTSPNG